MHARKINFTYSNCLLSLVRISRPVLFFLHNQRTRLLLVAMHAFIKMCPVTSAACIHVTDFSIFFVYFFAVPVQIVVGLEDIAVGINNTLLVACVAYGDPIPSVG